MQKNKRPEFIQIGNCYFKVDEIVAISDHERSNGTFYAYVTTVRGNSQFNDMKAEDILKRLDAKIIKED